MQKEVILSIAYGNYTLGSGGTDKAILSQQRMFSKAGFEYIYIFPFWKIGKISLCSSRNRWGVIRNGRFLFVKETASLISWIISNYTNLKEIHIHHLMYLNISELNFIIDAFQARIRFFLHDYYTICSNYNLLYNDKKFCGAEKRSDNKCSGCYYYSNKITDIIENKFLEKWKDRLFFVAPSEKAKEIWINAYPQYRELVHVVWHQKLRGVYKGNYQRLTSNDEIRVAYVGSPRNIKGFSQWKKILKECNEIKDYKFFDFGSGSYLENNVSTIKVDFKKDINAMIKALRHYEIDCAILWSIWPETYAYTYYECFAANAFVISNYNSGNICNQIQIRKNGIVLSDEEELYSFLKSPDLLREKINKMRGMKIYGPEELEESEKILEYAEKEHGIKLDKSCNYAKRKKKALDLIFSIIYYLLVFVYKFI